MRLAGLIMMAIGLLLVFVPPAVVLVMGWTAFAAQGLTLVALYGVLFLMGIAMLVVGRRIWS